MPSVIDKKRKNTFFLWHNFSESSNSFRWRSGFKFLSSTTTDFATSEIRAFASLTWWYRRAVDSSPWTVAISALGWLQTTSSVFMEYWLHSTKIFPVFPEQSSSSFWGSAAQFLHIDQFQWGFSLSYIFSKIPSSRKTTSLFVNRVLKFFRGSV